MKRAPFVINVLFILAVAAFTVSAREVVRQIDVYDDGSVAVRDVAPTPPPVEPPADPVEAPPVVEAPPAEPPPVTDPKEIVLRPGALNLQSGKTYVLEPGVYPVSGVSTFSKTTIISRVGKAIIQIPKEKQWIIDGDDNTLQGLTIQGGGVTNDKGKSTNDKSSVRVRGDRNVFQNGTVEKTKWVGITFDGDDCRLLHSTLRDCGMAGTGGKGDRLEVGWCRFINNNTVKSRDGACGFKITRSDTPWIHDCTFEGGYFTAVWFDIDVLAPKVERCTIDGTNKISRDYEGTAVKYEIGRPGGVVRNNRITNTWGPAVEVNETRGVKIVDNELSNGRGPEKAVLHIRDMRRKDADPKKQQDVNWQVWDLELVGNTFLDGKGILTGSNASTETVDLSERRIVIKDNKGAVEVRNPGPKLRP